MAADVYECGGCAQEELFRMDHRRDKPDAHTSLEVITMPGNPLAEGLRSSWEDGIGSSAPATATLAAETASPDPIPFSPSRIGSLLLVAGEVGIGGQIASHLRQHSFRVWQASTPAGALTILSYRVPDMLLLDMTLSGSEAFFQTIRNNNRTEDLPVVLLAEHAAGDAIKRTDMHGIEAHVTSALFYKSEHLARALLMSFSQHLAHWEYADRAAAQEEALYALRDLSA